jgi:hypothetical protein
MSDDSQDPKRVFKYPLGSGGSIRVRVSGRATTSPLGPEDGGEDEGGPGTADLGDEDQTFRRSKGITFYDLGTRLRSYDPNEPPLFEPDPGDFRLKEYYNGVTVIPSLMFDPDSASFREVFTDPNDAENYKNEYVELTYVGPYGFSGLEGSARALTAHTYFWPGLLKMGKPFETSKANGSSRTLQNCMPVPHDADSLCIDIVLGRKTGENPTAVRYRLGKTRDYLLHLGYRDAITLGPHSTWKEKKREKAKDVDERWNAYNTFPINVAQESGELGVKKVGHIKIESQEYYYYGPGEDDGYWPQTGAFAMYEPFDTEDVTQFKITNEDTFESPEVEFKPLDKATQVYLVPRIVTAHYTAKYNFFVNGPMAEYALVGTPSAWIAGRIPLYPRLPVSRPFGESYTASNDATTSWMKRAQAGGGGWYGEWWYGPVDTNDPNAHGRLMAIAYYGPGRDSNTHEFLYTFFSAGVRYGEVRNQFPFRPNPTVNVINGAYLYSPFTTEPQFYNHGGIPSGELYAQQFDPVGQLCGVIKQGPKKFYVWRKTRDVRRQSGYSESGLLISNFEDVI